MKINILNGKLRDDAEEPVEVTERDFWRAYLVMLSLRSGLWLYQKEVEVLSWILSKDLDTCYFSKPNSDRIMEEIPSLSKGELSRVKDRLITHNLVYEVEDDLDKRKKPTVLHGGLSSLQKFVRHSKEPITIVFPYLIK